MINRWLREAGLIFPKDLNKDKLQLLYDLGSRSVYCVKTTFEWAIVITRRPRFYKDFSKRLATISELKMFFYYIKYMHWLRPQLTLNDILFSLVISEDLLKDYYKRSMK